MFSSDVSSAFAPNRVLCISSLLGALACGCTATVGGGSEFERSGASLATSGANAIYGGDLVAWYSGDSVTNDGTGLASAWPDQSGKGNNITQSTRANRPAIVANHINGHTCLRFYGDDYLSLTSSFAGMASGSGVTIFAVVSTPSVPTSARTAVDISDSTGDTARVGRLQLSDAPSVRSRVTTGSGLITANTALGVTPNRMYVVQTWLAGGRLHTAANGIAEGTGVTTSLTAPRAAAQIAVGARTERDDHFIGHICEVVVARVNDETKRAQMASALATAYLGSSSATAGSGGSTAGSGSTSGSGSGGSGGSVSSGGSGGTGGSSSGTSGSGGSGSSSGGTSGSGGSSSSGGTSGSGGSGGTGGSGGSGGTVSAGSVAPPPPSAGGVTARLTASRTSGTAPLAVNFSARGTAITGVSDPFGEGLYHFDFDDPDAGTWPLSGFSRGEEYGPEVGHVFERPGTYDVLLTVVAPNGGYDTETVRITVADPATTFTGTRTVCISTSGNFSGCPAGATQTTSNQVSAINSAIADNRRVLLRCAESWTGGSAVSIPDGVDQGHLGTYGGCRNATITVTGGSQIILVNGDDWRITDLDIDGPNGDTNGISRGGANHLLINRVHILHARTGVETPGGYRDAASAGRHLIVANSEFDGIRHNGMYLYLWSAALLGNTIEDTTIGEHNMRFPWWEQVQISHGRYTRPGSIRHTLKAICNPDPPLECNRMVFSFNQAIGQTNQWMLDVGPMDDDPATGVELGAYYIIEHNWLRACDGAGCRVSRTINARWRYGYIRNNVIDFTGASGTCVQIQRRGAEPNPQHFRVYNNTCFRSDGSVTGVGISTADDVTVMNNFTVSHSGTPTSISASGATNTRYANNVTSTSTSAFVDSSPGTAATDFRIGTGSAAYNTGATPPAAWVDYDLSEAPQGAYDCGAFEYSP